MAEPRWLDERQARVWQSYLHMNQHLYAVLEDQLVRESGLSAADYVKVISVQQLSREALKRLAPAITPLARAEGLEAHARSVEMRLRA